MCICFVNWFAEVILKNGRGLPKLYCLKPSALLATVQSDSYGGRDIMCSREAGRGSDTVQSTDFGLV